MTVVAHGVISSAGNRVEQRDLRRAGCRLVSLAPGAGSATVRYHPQALQTGSLGRGVASLVARIVRDDEVGGSNPSRPDHNPEIAWSAAQQLLTLPRSKPTVVLGFLRHGHSDLLHAQDIDALKDGVGKLFAAAVQPA